MLNRKPAIPLSLAVAQSLGDISDPIITDYSLGVLVFDLYKNKELKGAPLRIKKIRPDKRILRSVITHLIANGLLKESSNFPSGSVYYISGRKSFSSYEVINCIDPFCYISHLSAMEYHGLSDRVPGNIIITTPDIKQWKEFAYEKMLKDVGEYLSIYTKIPFPKLRMINIKKIGKRNLTILRTKDYGSYRSIKDKNIRVSTIGRTFLDIIKEPELSGGILHVIDVYREHAQQYIKTIIEEIDKKGSKIDKVRAGYILESLCNIRSETIEKWTAFAQRGGSRKLDASQDYSPQYSERWSLSINVEGIESEY